jgi:4-amino-4-deoxy-L-arabinose transferase-like glycosyltransferase
MLAAAGLAAARLAGGPVAPDAATATLALRIVSACAGTAGVLAVYLLAGAFVSSPAALAAAALMAVLPLTVACAMDGVPDTLLSTLFAFGLWAALRASERPRLGSIAAVGALLSFTIAAKYNGAFLLFACVAAHVRARRRGPVPRGAWAAFLAGMLAGALLGFPWLLRAWPAVWAAVRYEWTHLFVVGHRWLAVSGRDYAFTYHLRYSILPATGPGLLGAMGLGLFVLALRSDGRQWVPLAALLPYHVVAEWAYLVPPSPERYALPLVGPYLVAAVAALEAAAGRLPGARVRAAFALAGFLGLAAWPAVRLARLLPALVPDTRDAMGAWIAAHVPPGTAVALEPPLAYYPDLARASLELTLLSPADGGAIPESGLTLASSLVYRRYLEHPDAAPEATALYRRLAAGEALHEESRPAGAYLFHNPTLRLLRLEPASRALTPGRRLTSGRGSR